jgi:hypothetical protein
MIDEKIRNEILDMVQRLAEKDKQRPLLTEPRPRWFALRKLRYKKGNQEVHFGVAIMVAKDEEECWQMLNELMEWHKKYVVDQKDVTRTEDYTETNL